MNNIVWGIKINDCKSILVSQRSNNFEDFTDRMKEKKIIMAFRRYRGRHRRSYIRFAIKVYSLCCSNEIIILLLHINMVCALHFLIGILIALPNCTECSTFNWNPLKLDKRLPTWHCDVDAERLSKMT